MARQDKTPEAVVAAGVVATAHASHADGHMFTPTGRDVLAIRNGTGGSVNVTIVSTQEVDGLAVADRVLAVAAGATRYVGKLQKSVYARASTEETDPGKVYVDFGTVDPLVTVAYLSV